MSNRKTTFFYTMLIAVASVAVGMVIASRLDLAPESTAQTTVGTAPPFNSAPITGGLTATTFRDVAKAVTPAVVNIRTESRQRTQDLSQFFGGGGEVAEFLDRDVVAEVGKVESEFHGRSPWRNAVVRRSTSSVMHRNRHPLTSTSMSEP